ncbi:MAG: hypothetical protein ALECFALPRED_009863 [Alectoria fallacina]|uniref:Uncharacterized protein n=1 Tax=Alectoria fallacina TaxID=1903189 RepID=A0A8H3J8J1_9LECA|nr:MAG: hypothetical protein ALECFALPRED_009863 [Alectoria fallacina]
MDSAEAIRRSTKKGIEQAKAWAKKDEEEALAKIKREREQSPEGLFVALDDEAETSTHVALTTLSSDPYAGLHSAKKRVRENVETDEKPKASFGPAKKAARKSGVRGKAQGQQRFSRLPMQRPKPICATIGPAKKVARKGGVRGNAQG